MSQHDDIELQKYLRGDSAISRRYHSLDKAEPDARLDSTILAAAQAEANRPVRPGWMIPVALAATVVLGVGLSLQLQTPRSGPQFDAIGELDARSRALPASDTASAPERLSEGGFSDGGTDQHRTVPILDDLLPRPSETPTGAPSRDAGGLEMAPPRSPPEAMMPENDGPAEALAEPPSESLSEQTPEPSTVAARETPHQRDPLPRAIVIAAEPAPAPKPASVPAPTTPVARTAQEEAPAADSAIALDGVAAPPREEAEIERYARTLEETQATDGSDTRTLEAPPVSSFQADGDTAPVTGLRSAARNNLDAARYLELIERTYRNGDEDAARRLMIDFRKKYPDYVLPESFPVEDPAPIDDQTPASPSSE